MSAGEHPRRAEGLRRVDVVAWQDQEIRRVAVHPVGDAEIRRIDTKHLPNGTIMVNPALAPTLTRDSMDSLLLNMMGGASSSASNLLRSAAGTASAGSASAGAMDEDMNVGSYSHKFGRAEPFLPLLEASGDLVAAAPTLATDSAAAGAASGSSLTGTALTPLVPASSLLPPRPNIDLLGVLLLGDRQAALLSINGQHIRAIPGTALGAGYRVRSIGKDFVLLSTPSGMERKELRRIWEVPTFAPSPAAPAGLQPPSAPAPQSGFTAPISADQSLLDLSRRMAPGSQPPPVPQLPGR